MHLVPYGKIHITTAQFAAKAHAQLSLRLTPSNESANPVISPHSVIVRFARLLFRYSQPDSRRPLTRLF